MSERGRSWLQRFLHVSEVEALNVVFEACKLFIALLDIERSRLPLERFQHGVLCTEFPGFLFGIFKKPAAQARPSHALIDKQQFDTKPVEKHKAAYAAN